jgi:DNA-binding NarL/FixJ family response regulator
MNTTEQVVKNRFRNVYRKLGLRRRIDLVCFNLSELELREKVQ